MSNDDPTLNFITPRVAAGVLFTDDQDRVLMVVPSYKDYLDIPGGYVENGETPFQAAQREVFEELGIKPRLGRLLVADWREDSPEVEGGAKLLLIFDGGKLSGTDIQEIAIDGDELTDFSFESVDDLQTKTIPRLITRIRHALANIATDEISYLENGTDTPEASHGER